MANESINWHDWNDETFRKAEDDDKLILLSITAPWCHWCHVMDRSTYSDTKVVKLINEKFIPIKIDADKRPDIQDKYLLGGWPTTAFLLPDGRILTGTTFMPPEAMIQKLLEADTLYNEEKATIKMHVTSMAAEAEADRIEAEISLGKLDSRLIETLIDTLRRDFDPVNGGFGVEPKFPYPDAVRFAFLQHRKTGSKEMLEIATKTLDGMMKLYDEVWGGFYRYGMKSDWTDPHFEKLLYVQAGVLDNYTEAYQVTGDDKYGEIASGVKAYLTRFLSDQEKGGFYGSQDADVGSHDPESEFIPGEIYFAKDEEERLAMGMPFIDKTIYTDWNGMMCSAYFRLYHAMADEHARDFALKTIDRILAENKCGDRMCHYFDGEQQVPGILSDQVYFAQALLDAYQTSGKRKYLAHSEELVQFMTKELQDVVDGGFYFQVFDPQARGELLERHKPFEENVAATWLFTQLYYLTGYEFYRELAEQTIQAISYPQIADSIVGVAYARALDLFASHPVHIILVGDRDSQETKDMLETSLHTYEPRKLVQVLDPDEDSLTIGDMTYDAEEQPLAYVCVQNICAQPVKGNQDLAMVLQDVIGPTPS